MGDRANVFVRTDRNNPKRGVYFYAHSSGTLLPDLTRMALAKRWRWDDAGYLARIIFDTITEEEHGEETGYSISTHIDDGENRVVYVDPYTQTVGVTDELGKSLRLPCVKTWTFEEFVKLKEGFSEEFWELLERPRPRLTRRGKS